VFVWWLGWIDPPEAIARSLALRAAAAGGGAAGATLEAIPCPPLRRLRLYVVCTRECDGVWRVMGVSGLRSMLLSDPGRVPPEPPDVAQRRINDAVSDDRPAIDEAGAREMIGCHMRLSGLHPGLVLDAFDRARIAQADGDEDRLQAIAEGLFDSAGIERIGVERAADHWESTFDYWAVEEPGRPIDTLRVVLETDGRLRTVEILATEVRPPSGG
jgi:hypothetical protein